MGIIQDVLVEQDNTGTQSNPGTAPQSDLSSPRFRFISSTPFGTHSHHVEGRVQSGLGRLLLVQGRVDGRQGGLIAGDLCGRAQLFSSFGRTHRGRDGASLLSEKPLKIERTRP